MKLKSGRLDIFKNVVAVIILISIFCYLLLNWGSFPTQISGHYNASGVVDRWGVKGELLILPFTALVLYIFMTVAERFPQAWNTGVTITEGNKSRVYALLKSMLVTVKLIIVAILCYLCVVQSTAKNLFAWFLPFFLILMFGSIAFYIVKLIRIK